WPTGLPASARWAGWTRWPRTARHRGCSPCRWTSSMPTTACCAPWRRPVATVPSPRTTTACSRWSRCIARLRCARPSPPRSPPASIRCRRCRRGSGWRGCASPASVTATSIPRTTCAWQAIPMTEFPGGIAFEQARALLEGVAAARRLPIEQLPLARCHGRVLAEDIAAPIALQPFDNSAMDGFACRHADIAASGARLRLVGEQFAGRALGLRVGERECIRITTGAPMPAGADTVAIREYVQVEGDTVAIPAGIRPGANVRRAGEDCAAGDAGLQAGVALDAAQVSLAASLGIERLPVSARPTVAVFTTGDELVEPGMPLRPGEIYNSNRELLMGLLRAEGLEP